MSRDHIRSVVIKYLCRAVGTIDPNTIDTSRSMKELGANSLDIVEVVSSAMRELKLKVPRKELATLQNLDGLIDLLERTAASTAEAPKS